MLHICWSHMHSSFFLSLQMGKLRHGEEWYMLTEGFLCKSCAEN